MEDFEDRDPQEGQGHRAGVDLGMIRTRAKDWSCLECRRNT